MLVQKVVDIQKELMKKVESRPFNVKGVPDGNFNYIHQEYIADAFRKVRKLLETA